MARSPTIETGQDGAGRSHHTDAGRRAPRPPFADVENPLAVDRDIHRLLEIGPHGDRLALGGADLNAVVLSVTHIDALRMDQQTVRQVELIRGCLAGLAPGAFEVPVRGEAMHPGVAIPVGDI